MPRVSHHFVADRPIDAVFDVVATARLGSGPSGIPPHAASRGTLAAPPGSVTRSSST
jgi:hypothetical protein